MQLLVQICPEFHNDGAPVQHVPVRCTLPNVHLELFRYHFRSFARKYSSPATTWARNSTIIARVETRCFFHAVFDTRRNETVNNTSATPAEDYTFL